MKTYPATQTRDELERLEAASDAYWALRAERAKKEGFLGAEEGEKLPADLLNTET